MTDQDAPTPTCCCGDPTTTDVVHRTDGPCYMREPAPTSDHYHRAADLAERADASINAYTYDHPGDHATAAGLALALATVHALLAIADHLKPTEPAAPCGVYRTDDDHGQYPCVAPKGHTGRHRDSDGDEW